ncbi:hypothetical protein GCM10020229_67140 [Kitasatospora albolonga]
MREVGDGEPETDRTVAMGAPRKRGSGRAERAAVRGRRVQTVASGQPLHREQATRSRSTCRLRVRILCCSMRFMGPRAFEGVKVGPVSGQVPSGR